MRSDSYAEISPVAEQGIQQAAKELGAKTADIRGYYLAGGEWDAETADELAAQIVECWCERNG